MKIAAVIATLGRPDEASDLANDLAAQSRVPDETIFCVMDQADAPRTLPHPGMRVLLCERKGSCAQRNIGIAAVAADTNVIVFMDDDFVPAPDYFQQLEQFFRSMPHAMGVTGLVLADGVSGPGVSRAEAVRLISNLPDVSLPVSEMLRPRVGLYGCNMALRAPLPLDLRFDESLPLYGWLEDLDLSTRIAKRGPLYQFDGLRGVHRGVKRGRTSGLRFGYSQVSNPLFLALRRRAPLHYAAWNICRNVSANLLRALRPEPWVDRRGRLKGNFLAFADLLRGRLRPDRILTLKS